MWRIHVASVRALCAAHYTAAQIEAWVGGRRPEHYGRAMTDLGQSMFVAERAGEVIGFSSLRDDEVWAVYVDPERGRGAGGALLDAVEAEARARGVRRLRLMASLNSVHFYERHGYRALHRSSVPLPSTELPAMEMEKKLA